MINLEPVTPANTSIFRRIRLTALQDSPHAFGSTYAREIQFTEADWLARVANWNGENGIGFLAMDGTDACGLCGALIETDDLSCAQLVSMWIAPSNRKQGVGRLLVNEVIRWARNRSLEALKLFVTSNNELAVNFYHRMGFVFTGKTEPYPNDSSLEEYEMLLIIS